MTDLDRIIAEMREHLKRGRIISGSNITDWADRLAALAGAGPVACHRLHTSDGKARWMWVDGPPSLQAVDDARNFGWTLELAYTPHAPAKAREVTDADVMNALNAFYNGDPFPKYAMKRALATFAEGEK